MDKPTMEQVIQCIKDEPEFPGPIPLEVVEAVCDDPEDVLRDVVRVTKRAIIQRVKELYHG